MNWYPYFLHNLYPSSPIALVFLSVLSISTTIINKSDRASVLGIFFFMCSKDYNEDELYSNSNPTYSEKSLGVVRDNG
jgi:hypothetical protein